MRGLKLWMTICSAAVLGLLAKPGAGNTITADGNLSDWNVNLQTAYTTPTPTPYAVNGVTGSYNQFVQSSFTPTNATGIYYVVENPADAPAEDEGYGFCDVKALYATFDSTTAYFAVVTSSNPNGTGWNGYGSNRFGPGDLGVTVTQNGVKTTYGIGARPIDLSQAPYGQVTINANVPDQRNPPTWVYAGSDSPVNYNLAPSTGASYTSFSTNRSVVAQSPAWAHVDNNTLPTNFDAYFLVPGAFNGVTKTDNPGAITGYAAAAWQQVSTPQGLASNGQSYAGYNQADPYASPVNMQPYSTWVFEAAVPLSDLGISNGGGAAAFGVSFFGADCGNDSLSLNNIPFGAGPPATPEPMTAIFFGTGLVAIGGYLARRKMQRKMFGQ